MKRPSPSPGNKGYLLCCPTASRQWLQGTFISVPPLYMAVSNRYAGMPTSLTLSYAVSTKLPKSTLTMQGYEKQLVVIAVGLIFSLWFYRTSSILSLICPTWTHYMRQCSCPGQSTRMNEYPVSSRQPFCRVAQL
jgi:hypothetical protein